MKDLEDLVYLFIGLLVYWFISMTQ